MQLSSSVSLPSGGPAGKPHFFSSSGGPCNNIKTSLLSLMQIPEAPFQFDISIKSLLLHFFRCGQPVLLCRQCIGQYHTEIHMPVSSSRYHILPPLGDFPLNNF